MFGAGAAAGGTKQGKPAAMEVDESDDEDDEKKWGDGSFKVGTMVLLLLLFGRAADFAFVFAAFAVLCHAFWNHGWPPTPLLPVVQELKNSLKLEDTARQHLKSGQGLQACTCTNREYSGHFS